MVARGHRGSLLKRVYDDLKEYLEDAAGLLVVESKKYHDVRGSSSLALGVLAIAICPWMRLTPPRRPRH